MGHRFANLAFTPSVQAAQREQGSRDNYQRMEAGEDNHFELTAREADFIASRDSFYMASVNENGWPYLQHRGGSAGFIRVLNARQLFFADYRGNRQYISTGNLRADNRVSLFFMDYPGRKRLKMLGRVEEITLGDETFSEALQSPGPRILVERGFLITVEAFDWNCPQHITPRFTEEQVQARIQAALIEQAAALKATQQ